MNTFRREEEEPEESEEVGTFTREDECVCPIDERTYSGFIIIHNSRENCYTCNLCGKVH